MPKKIKVALLNRNNNHKHSVKRQRNKKAAARLKAKIVK